MIRRYAAIGALVAFEAGTIRLLHWLGGMDFLAVDWPDLATWLQVNPAEDTLAASLRLIALGCAYWLTVTTVLYLLARLSRISQAIGAVEWATLPAVRRVVDRAAALTLTAAAIAGPSAPAFAEEPPAIVFDLEDGVPTPRITSDEETIIEPPGVNGPGYTPAAAGRRDVPSTTEPTAAVDPASPSTYEVVTGDNLWCIAQAHVELISGEDVPTSEIAAYWRIVIEANRTRLISGDPDLIYPGEEIMLPSTQGVPP